MTSSTFNSDAPATSGWRTWLATFAVAAVSALVLVGAFLVIVDPYDTGRFSPLPQHGMFDRNPRTANASRGRNTLFNAAVIGNSTGEALMPARLSTATTLHFVQLTIPKTGPREHVTLLQWFTSHHHDGGAMVIVTDTATWCTSDPNPALASPFPFWLYGGDVDYLRNLPSWHALELAFRRVRLMVGLHAPVSRLDGFWDYETEWGWSADLSPPLRDRPASEAATDATANPQLAFPSIERLGSAIRQLSPLSLVVIVVPPVFVSDMPPQNSPEASRIAQCKAALAKTVAERPRGGFLDFNVDNATTRNPANFIDAVHYRAVVARQMEDSIAAVVAPAVASSNISSRE